MSRWDIPRRERWPYAFKDNSPTPAVSWYELRYPTYEACLEEYVQTGNPEAFQAMLDLVESE